MLNKKKLLLLEYKFSSHKVRVPATNSENLNSINKTHVVDRKYQIYKLSCDLYMHVMAHTYLYVYKHT